MAEKNSRGKEYNGLWNICAFLALCLTLVGMIFVLLRFEGNSLAQGAWGFLVIILGLALFGYSLHRANR